MFNDPRIEQYPTLVIPRALAACRALMAEQGKTARAAAHVICTRPPFLQEDSRGARLYPLLDEELLAVAVSRSVPCPTR